MKSETARDLKDDRPILEARQTTSNARKVRAALQHNYKRYTELAREAAVRGDDVEVQNCYQHAEHYFRTMKGGE